MYAADDSVVEGVFDNRCLVSNAFLTSESTFAVVDLPDHKAIVVVGDGRVFRFDGVLWQEMHVPEF